MSGFYEWDWKKEAASPHRIPFSAAYEFEWNTALEARDDRRAYAEVRTAALGFIGERLHVMIFTRRGEIIRIISLRKANAREITRYVQF